MKPTQFPITKFSRSSSKVFGRPIAPSSYPSLNLLPWPTPQELRSPLRPSTQYSSSHSKAKVSTTLHSTTIRTPKYQQPKITRVLVGTDTTATKSLPKHISITHIYQHFSYIEISAGDKDPVQTPPNLEVQIRHLLTLQKPRPERAVSLKESRLTPSRPWLFRLPATELHKS
jgi:hypothetical protein